MGNAGEIRGLVIAYPQNLGSLEASQCRVARDFDEALGADALGDFGAFGGSALVIPEQGRADDLVISIQKDRAVHLARQADTDDLGGIHGADDITDGVLGALPPIAGMLFAPEGVWARNGVFGQRHRHDPAICITDNCFGTRGADV
ncbi:MAG: hypothetical protein EBS29_09960 [Chloroflexia bacterium]|nr:hypothetical protein [Chloroflexia bacterium]